MGTRDRTACRVGRVVPALLGRGVPIDWVAHGVLARARAAQGSVSGGRSGQRLPAEHFTMKGRSAVRISCGEAGVLKSRTRGIPFALMALALKAWMGPETADPTGFAGKEGGNRCS